MILRSGLLLLAALFWGVAQAAPAPFDLAGPKLQILITRGEQILPASEVPNLVAGDKLWIKTDFPASQSANYLMVAAFLSGSTNPPPKSWFYPCKTWTSPCKRDGLTITVPEGAQQVLVFLAPATNGDFSTLVDAVRGRPGAFVRASQDLNQAALDRSRLDRYLATIHMLNNGDPATLKEVAPLLARSLSIKVDEKCLDKVPELQAPCLTQGQESLILNDGHSLSIVSALTSGPASDLLLEASTTPQAGFGYYSPYIASVVDIVRILDSFGTAQYQYIPALATQQGNELALTLNAPPSFHDPKSVLVVGLPAVEQPQLPPLHAVDPSELYCASRTSLVLPVEGAPLVFSTGYAHDLTLTLSGADGKTISLPAKPDAAQGGYVVDTTRLRSATLSDTVKASLQGYWGFVPYKGPDFQLRNAHAKAWTLADGDAQALIVGRQDTVHLEADSASCVDGIMLGDAAGKELKADWKTVKPGVVEVKLPLQDANPGAMSLLVRQYGMAQPQSIPIQVFSAAGRFDAFDIHVGDAQGVLKGSRLDQVANLTMGGVTFLPGELSTKSGNDELPMIAQDAPAAAALKQNRTIAAKVVLKDGRVFNLDASVDAPRPKVVLIGKSVQPSHTSGDSNIQLADQDELPQDARLTFSLRAQFPPTFARDQTIEVATADTSFSYTLSLTNGGIRLEDSKIAVATLDPAKAFGPSAYGPLQFRVNANGVTGDWLPLASLVRLPALKDLKCPASPDLACKLSGADLFLIDSVSADAQFGHPSDVPGGFPGYTLLVPRPAAGRLYVKLRDDPSVINPVTLEVQQLPPSADEIARAAAKARQDEAQAKNDAPIADSASTAAQQQTPSITPKSSAASGGQASQNNAVEPNPAP